LYTIEIKHNMVNNKKTPLAFLEEYPQGNFYPAYLAENLLAFSQKRYQQLLSYSQGKYSPKILLATSDTVDFLATFVAAVSCNFPVFLGNSQWGKQEWEQALQLVNPNVIVTDGDWQERQIPALAPFPIVISRPIGIATGGSSGKLRFVVHNWETLLAAVAGLRQYFQVSQIHSLCVLPLYHVSGLMQFVRSLVTSGKFVLFSSWKDMLADSAVDFWNFPQKFSPKEFFLSLVPTQLQRLLTSTETASWLSQFQTIFLGGAAAWQALLETAKQWQLPLSPTYGMTETAAQVATLKPQDFLLGKDGVGCCLPHAKITIQASSQTVGIVAIASESLAWGYYPNQPFDGKLITDDLGYFDAAGYLHLVGRNSDKIVTGGENVFPREVEAAIRETGWVRDVLVTGIPDSDWGQVVVALYVPRWQDQSFSQKVPFLNISRYKYPKIWIPVEKIPRNDRYKIDREAVDRIIAEWQRSAGK
jgi:O-succinylbenzoic acid--CoA ligase